MLGRDVSDRNILDEFVSDFIHILEKHVVYVLVSGYVAICHGRARGTEDIDVIVEKIEKNKFIKLHNDLVDGGFESIQNDKPEILYNNYLLENTSIRYVRHGTLIPDMEVKLVKDELDEYQLEKRIKLPLTETEFYFSTPETNIAFKEELLKSDKDLEDARHLRIIYEEKLNQQEIQKIKDMIRRLR